MIVTKWIYNFQDLIKAKSKNFWGDSVEGQCPNCGQQLKDSLLTHCSDKCRLEAFFKSDSVCILLDIDEEPDN